MRTQLDVPALTLAALAMSIIASLSACREPILEVSAPADGSRASDVRGQDVAAEPFDRGLADVNVEAEVGGRDAVLPGNDVDLHLDTSPETDAAVPLDTSPATDAAVPLDTSPATDAAPPVPDAAPPPPDAAPPPPDAAPPPPDASPPPPPPHRRCVAGLEGVYTAVLKIEGAPFDASLEIVADPDPEVCYRGSLIPVGEGLLALPLTVTEGGILGQTVSFALAPTVLGALPIEGSTLEFKRMRPGLALCGAWMHDERVLGELAAGIDGYAPPMTGCDGQRPACGLEDLAGQFGLHLRAPFGRIFESRLLLEPGGPGCLSGPMLDAAGTVVAWVTHAEAEPDGRYSLRGLSFVLPVGFDPLAPADLLADFSLSATGRVTDRRACGVATLTYAEPAARRRVGPFALGRLGLAENADADCRFGLVCVRDADCAQPQTCAHGLCVLPLAAPPEQPCVDVADCSAGEVCGRGQCYATADCSSAGQCPENASCEEAACLPPCVGDDECRDGNVCGRGVCGLPADVGRCVFDADCPGAQWCDLDNTCAEPDLCGADLDCFFNRRCFRSICADRCANDAGCELGMVCRAAVCVPVEQCDDADDDDRDGAIDCDDDDCAAVPACQTAYSEPQVQSIIDARCGGCHTGGGRQGGLRIDAPFRATTFGIPSFGAPATDLIEPGDHLRSYIWRKLDGTQWAVGGGGSRMPVGVPLTRQQITRFGRFIDALPVEIDCVEPDCP